MGHHEILARAIRHFPLQDNGATTSIEGGATIVGGKTADQMTVAGPTDWLPKALRFDGSGDRIEAAAPTVAVTEGTVAAWVRLLSTPAGYAPLATVVSPSGPRLLINVHADRRLGYNWTNASAQHLYRSGSQLTPGEYALVAVSVTPSEARFFVNGVLDGVNTASHPATTWAGDLQIAKYGNNASLYTHADLAGAALWTEALSDAEHAALFAGPSPKPTAVSAAGVSAAGADLATQTAGGAGWAQTFPSETVTPA